jgi:circadian clock protein KaiC
VQPRTKVLSKNNSSAKAPTGIAGLDELTQGGLPRSRSTLVSGRAGCGKTVLGLEFLVRGAVEFGEPEVIVSFEETPEDLARNVASFGFDLNELVRQRKLALEFVSVERSEIEETGEYNLDGLFIRLAHAIDSVDAKRVLLGPDGLRLVPPYRGPQAFLSGSAREAQEQAEKAAGSKRTAP